MQKSVFTRYFSVCAIIILMCITVLGGLFLIFASQNFRNEKLDLLYKNASHAAEITMENYQRLQLDNDIKAFSHTYHKAVLTLT